MMCHDMLAEVLPKVLDPSDPNMEYIFGDASQTTRETVHARLQLVDDACSAAAEPNVVVYPDADTYLMVWKPPPAAVTRTSTIISPTLATTTVTELAPATPCAVTSSALDGTWLDSVAMASQATNSIIFCPAFYNYPFLLTECWSATRSTILIHELTHLPSVMNFGSNICGDYAYGEDILTIEDPAQRLLNADSYMIYVQMASLGCVNGVLPPEPDGPPVRPDIPPEYVSS